MDLTETFVSRQDIFAGRIVRLHVDTVTLPDGTTTSREVIDHPGGVGILAMDEEDRVFMVQQYRYAFGRATWEIPAGKRDPGEEPLATGIRELQEEVGVTAERWLPMGELIPSPGCYAERLYLFLARGLTMGDTHPDEGEFLTVARVPFTDLYHACLSGEIQDAKTVVAVLKAKAMLGR